MSSLRYQAFAASLIAVFPFVIASGIATDCFTGLVPARLLPSRWRPMRGTIASVAGFAIVAAIATDQPPALWVAIAASTAGAWWTLGAHDNETEREENDAAFRAKQA